MNFLRSFHMCSTEVKLNLFRTFCYPVYCAYLWCRYRVKTMRTLQIAYHNILKKFLGFSKFSSTSFTCAVFHVKSFGELNRRYVYTFEGRIDRSENSIVRALNMSSLRFSSQLRRKWIYDLYTFVPG